MQYGLIGERLGHSYSKKIHSLIADYDYELLELAPEKVSDFMTGRKFKAINVTIPYKQTVIPYLDYIDPAAEQIGAVNTVISKGGKLYGYNTDFYGMKAQISFMGLGLAGKKVLILGTGGTSKTSYAAAKSLGAKEIYRVSRRESENILTYSQAMGNHSDANFIINTTPV